MYVIDKTDQRHFATTWFQRGSNVIIASSHAHIDIDMGTHAGAHTLMGVLDSHSKTPNMPLRLPRPEGQVIS